MTAAISAKDKISDLITPVTYAGAAVPGAPLNNKRISVEGDEKLLKTFLPASQFDVSASKKKDENKDNSYTTMMLWQMFAMQNADENDTIDGGSIVDFLETLEKAGIDVTPFKQAIETATGKTYQEFAASSHEGRSSVRFDVSGFYDTDMNTGARLPRISNSGFDSLKVLRIAATDNAGAGNCAKGVANIAEALGWDIQRGHATNWDKTLPQHGWVKLHGVNAENAPDGAILVYNSDIEMGRKARNSGGGIYGHVEMAANGLFVSDKARNHAGGSVPENFAGAYIYVGNNAPASNLRIEQAYNHDGLKTAANHLPAPTMAPA